MRATTVVVGCLVVVLGLTHFSWADDPKPAAADQPRFKIAKETTYVTGPVRPDGTIDYVEAINERLSKGVTKENNAAILMLEAVTDIPAPAGHYERVWQKLGLPVPQTANNVPVPQADPPGMDDALKHPWVAEKHPEVAHYLEPLEGRLNLMVEASQRDHYYMPLVREHDTDPLVSVLLPHLSSQRHLVNALKARAMLRLGDEDIDAFCRDAVAIVRLGRLMTHAPTLIENLVGAACEANGLDAINTAATGGWLPEAQIDHLLKELRAAPAPRQFYDVFEGGERGFLLEFLQTAAVHGVAEAQKALEPMRDKTILPPVDSAAKDWNAAMVKANGWYDRLADAGKQPTHAARMKATNAVLHDLDALKSKYAGWKSAFAPVEDRLIILVVPSMERAYTVETRAAVQRELTETALALAAFHIKMGEYPPELRLLAPAYFKSEPIDGFTDKPLTYRTEGKGYTLMSVGPDGQVGKQGAKAADDLTIEAMQ